ncbi:MAG TPA: uroporphyrinogen-III C-methyltransferase [Burkholderiales bacterium]|nr:uroporphyrinogen-III C-methyltransferase [Burkholderiales bacterium]
MADRTDDKQLIAAARTPRPSLLPIIALLLAIAAFALAGWQWFDSRRSFGLLEHEVAKRLGQVDALIRDTRAQAAQSRDAMGDAAARLGQLEARMFETQNQRLALESLYRDLSRSRDEWTLAEVEQALLVANQQLQLAGNVKAALIALETADARLARMDRPQLTPLRRVIDQDMQRLKAAPYVDVVGIALRLDNIMNQIDTMSLAMEQRPARPDLDPEATGTGLWPRLWREVKRDLRDLVRIQNVEKPEVALLSPEQGFFLRENLKARMLGARLSLLARDEASFKADLTAASEWLSRYYDGSNRTVATAQSALKQLLQVDIGRQLPDISASLDAARNFKHVRERVIR